jgi:hypothetical protein
MRKKQNMVEGKYLVSSSREVQGSLARLLYEKNGPEVLPLIAAIFKEFGVVEGKKARNKLGDLDFTTAVRTFFRPALESKPPRAEIVELTDSKLVLKGLTCAMGLRGAGRAVCQAIMEIDKAIVSNLTKKKVELNIIHTMAANDPFCLVEFLVLGNNDPGTEGGS